MLTSRAEPPEEAEQQGEDTDAPISWNPATRPWRRAVDARRRPRAAQTPAIYNSGADDKTIKIGTTAPLSGPVSAFAQIAKSAEAYFKKVNAEGSINGRQIQMIIADDAYSPPKTVEQTRRLVESDEVF